jgi:hypothetical protein
MALGFCVRDFWLRDHNYNEEDKGTKKDHAFKENKWFIHIFGLSAYLFLLPHPLSQQ